MYGANLNLDDDGNVESVSDGAGTPRRVLRALRGAGPAAPERPRRLSGWPDDDLTAPIVDLSDPTPSSSAPPHEELAELRRTDAGLLAGDGRPARALGGAQARRRRARRAQPELFSATEGGVVLEDLDDERLAGMREHAAGDGPAAPRLLPAAADPELQRARSSARSRTGSARSARRPSTRCAGRATSSSSTEVASCCRPRSSASSWAFRRRTGVPASTRGRAQPAPAGHRDRARGRPTRQRQRRHGDVRDPARGEAARHEPPPTTSPTSSCRPTSATGTGCADIEFGSFFVQLVTAGKTPPRRCCRQGLLALLEHPDQHAGAAGRPVRDPAGGRGDPALGQPAALLPPHGDVRTPSCAARRSGPATRSRCTTPRPTATRTSSTTRRLSTSTRNPNPHLSFGIARALLPRGAPRPARGQGLLRGAAHGLSTIELTGKPSGSRPT